MIPIRRAVLGDLEACKALLFETWRSTFALLYDDELVDEICHTWGAPTVLESRILASDGKFLVADIAGIIAGMAFVKEPNEAGIGYLSQLYVLPPFQGQQIGKALLSASEKAFAHCRFMRLNVDRLNQSAVNFYLHHGYHDTHMSFVRELKSHQVEALIFEKAIQL